jgi:hypothetical protein
MLGEPGLNARRVRVLVELPMCTGVAGHRLEEVHRTIRVEGLVRTLLSAGFPRDGTDMPVEYPEALKPQSWAAGAPLLVLRTVLGLDVVEGEACGRFFDV